MAGDNMNNIEQTIQFINELAAQFGAKNEDALAKDYVFRNNTHEDTLQNGAPFFGFISPEEANSGPYHDFSLVVFPSNDGSWLVCIGVGTQGFQNDYDIASQPGARRLFKSIIGPHGFCKTSFLDIETPLPRPFTANLPHLKNVFKAYSKVLPVCAVIDDPLSSDCKKVIAAFVAAYARLRGWPSNETHRQAIEDSIQKVSNTQEPDEESDVRNLLLKRRYVILQGAPGTGKTRLAKIIARNLDAKTFFTQFHAQTSYDDFIHGIRPNLIEGQVGYIEHKGVFYEALKYAEDNPQKKVVLIIDEINRANLSNILGPIFYLFEYDMNDKSVAIDIGGGFKVDTVPENLFVIGTMNTADRSLAVVDFALRRRFAWYNMVPHEIKLDKFFKTDFLEFEKIFTWHATSEELSLHPGQGYFIADSEEDMTNRIRYELLPLIREYLAEGLLQNAKEAFAQYFWTRIHVDLLE